MTAVLGREVMCAVQVVIGVDTHQDQHVAVAIDQQGVRLAERHAPATSYGYEALERWSREPGRSSRLNPNPLKGTDGWREDSGRVGEGATGEMAGLHWGRLEVGGWSSVAA